MQTLRCVTTGCLVVGTAFMLAWSASAHAQSYPHKPIRLVQSSPAGGSSDALSRDIANRLSIQLGQPVIVDNRPGAGGIIGTETVARAVPDGYTLLFTGTHHSVMPSLHEKLPYDTIADFAPVSVVAYTTSVLNVHPALPVHTVKELIALAKAKPGQLNYSAGTTGATAHLGAELLKTMAGVNIVHVPYKGGAAQLTALLTGEVQMSFTTMPAALPHMRAGRLRTIAVAGIQRSPVLPDVPTVAESGLPGFDVRVWNGILAPRKTPQAIITRLNTEIAAVVKDPDVYKRISATGAETASTTPEEFNAYMKSEVAKWGKVVKFAGIKAN